MTSDVRLRDVAEADLPIFFEQQRDPAANQMAAFTAKDPADREAFAAKWAKILGNDTVKKTILVNGQVAGSVSAFVASWSGQLEVTYWLGREYWGRGIATKALTAFLGHLKGAPFMRGLPRITLPRSGCWQNAASRYPVMTRVLPTRTAKRSKKWF